MICGNCHEHHETTSEVRDCYEREHELRPEPATEKQMSFLNRLLEERGLPVVIPGEIDKRTASDRITALVNGPKPTGNVRVAVDAPTGRAAFGADIPAGYYATAREHGNDLDFWLVQKPQEGQWAGRTFIKRILGGHEPTRITFNVQLDAARAIRRDGFEKAAKMFAEKLGRCYRCGRTLTDETSRSLGIGPDCRTKVA